MKVEQLYTKCLAQGAYYIESDGEAAVIDPLREVNQYLDLAEQNNAKIKYIFETHFHADFVSGHVTLSEKTGAPIVFGPNANPSFDVLIATDGQVFQLGKLTITVLHTPGHTLESSTYLLKDEAGNEIAIFTGDTLFLGDVGRPDLAQKVGSISQEDLAGMLYDSLRNKIMTLPDEITVYPGHGAGSACGKSMMKETVDTLGNQKRMNYALRANMTKEEFIQEVTEGLASPPAYFPLNVKMNKEGYTTIDEVIRKGTKALSVADFKQLHEKGDAVVLDVRHQNDFVEGYIPGSIFIGIDGGFAPWVGAILADTTTPILLVTPEGREEETVTRLARVGFDNTLGFLKGGIKAWQEAGNEVTSIKSINAWQMADEYNQKRMPVLDVRKPSEVAQGHIENALNIPLSELMEQLSEVPKETFYLHCAGGYRSVIAASLLKRQGFDNMVDIKGGYGAIQQLEFPIVVEASSCGTR